jgi:hypothetical protein
MTAEQRYDRIFTLTTPRSRFASLFIPELKAYLRELVTPGQPPPAEQDGRDLIEPNCCSRGETLS